MKKCTYCGKEYGDESNICPLDNAPLQNVSDAQGQDTGADRNSSGGQGRLIPFEGIGLLEANPIANHVLALCKILAFVFIFIGVTLCIPLVKTSQSHGDYTNEQIILGCIGFVMFFGAMGGFLGLQWIVRRRLYRLGDWYKLLEHSASAEDHDDAKKAANELLALTSMDLTTSKLKAKAHLYLGYYQTVELGAGHWEPLIALLNAILEQEPGNAVFRLDRGQAYHKIAKYDDALRDLDLLVADTEHLNFRAYSLRISCLTSINRLDEAKLACENLRAISSKFPNMSAVTTALVAHKAEIEAKIQRGAVS